MAIVYFDSSAFVKLVVEEDESDLAAALWDGCDAAVSSRLAYPEVRAALAAAGRDHRLDARAQHQAEVAWEEYWAATRAVELTDEIAARAGGLAGEHALRGADAVHLASALVLGPEDLLFAAWDQRLRTGVETAGIRLAPAAWPAGQSAAPGSTIHSVG
jgi:predicted nucleic acid-binding protein